MGDYIWGPKRLMAEKQSKGGASCAARHKGRHAIMSGSMASFLVATYHGNPGRCKNAGTD